MEIEALNDCCIYLYRIFQDRGSTCHSITVEAFEMVVGLQNSLTVFTNRLHENEDEDEDDDSESNEDTAKYYGLTLKSAFAFLSAYSHGFIGCYTYHVYSQACLVWSILIC